MLYYKTGLDSKLRTTDIDLPPLQCFCPLIAASFTAVVDFFVYVNIDGRETKLRHEA